MSDFLIIGAGINGLLLARELSAAGAELTLLDQGRTGRESSWAGGGIVSPLYPWRYASAITVLATWAQDFYPRLADSLQAETGIDVEYHRTGLLMLDAQDTDAAQNWARRHDQRMEGVDAAYCYKQEGLLAPGFATGLWMPDVANVRNPRLCQALTASLRQQTTVSLYEDARVVAFRHTHRRIESVQVKQAGKDMELAASHIIFCAGAWSGTLASLLGLDIAVEPVKGQMLLYKFPEPPISSILLTDGRYLIPRKDGHVLAGSTLEHEGFDKSPTATARRSLRQSAARLLPVLQELQPVAQWAGLRPGASGGVPYIGRAEPFENLYLNAGQYRNGLVLAPASARLLADCLLQREPVVDPSPYLPVTHAGLAALNPGPAS